MALVKGSQIPDPENEIGYAAPIQGAHLDDLELG